MAQEQGVRVCEPFAGASALWMLLHRFRLQRGAATQVGLQKLMAHEYHGDLEL